MVNQPSIGIRRLARPVIVGLFFVLYLLLGLRVVGDYPIPTDEPSQDLLGEETIQYVAGNRDEWTTLHDIRYQAPFAEAIIRGIASSLVPSKPIGVPYVLLRHLVIFLFFYAGVVALYRLGLRVLGDWRFALLACLLLVLTPRFFAHSFFNSKDMPTVGLFVIAMLTLYRLLDTPTLLRALLHGIVVGALIATRPMGLFVPFFTAIGMFREWVALHENIHGRRAMLYWGSLSMGVSIAATILFWPLLWTDPIGNFAAVMSWSERAGGGFYFGEVLESTPWHYLPVWIAITVPVYTLVLFFLGFGKALAGMTRRSNLLLLLWVFSPWAAIVVLKMGIFDEWRHVFFLYPGMILIAAMGLKMLFDFIPRFPGRLPLLLRALICAALLLCLSRTAGWMLLNHPLQFAYFSVPSSWVRDRFDLDYWALSSRLALAAIADHDEDERIPIAVSNTIIAVNAAVFFPDKVFPLESPDNADYIIDNFRNAGYRETYSREKLFSSVVVDGLELMNVYKLRP